MGVPFGRDPGGRDSHAGGRKRCQTGVGSGSHAKDGEGKERGLQEGKGRGDDQGDVRGGFGAHDVVGGEKNKRERKAKEEEYARMNDGLLAQKDYVGAAAL